MMDASTELEPIAEAAAHELARTRHRDIGAYAALTLDHGPEVAAMIWLRAAWLWRQGIEEEAA